MLVIEHQSIVFILPMVYDKKNNYSSTNDSLIYSILIQKKKKLNEGVSVLYLNVFYSTIYILHIQSVCNEEMVLKI